MPASPETVICLYRVRAGSEAEFEAVLRGHWPALQSLGLVTETPPRHYRGAEQSGEPLFVEIFEWMSAESAELAHQHPEVMAVWERMGALTETRDGRPEMEFPHVRPIEILGGA